ncbi:MAG: GNAT family N-acetyltransferase [Spirochaetia bacterium]
MIFTLPPGHTKVSLWEYVQNGFLLTPIFLGFRNYRNSMECEAFVEHTHEELMRDRPHYYLWGLAVEPGRKRTGIGAALMTPVLSKADTSKMPIYLETHDENNVPYYQRHGFAMIRTARIPKHSLQIWCMLREPT